MSQTTNKDAIATLLIAGDEIAQVIDEEIANLEKELSELKRLRKMLVPPFKNKSIKKGKYDELEQRIYDEIKEHGPCSAKVICGLIGEPSYTRIGKAVASSSRLQKDGANIVIAEAD